MNYLDMILAEAATPVKEKNQRSDFRKGRSGRSNSMASRKSSGASSEFSVSYKKTTALEKKKAEISRLERMIASGKDSDGKELNPDKIRALKAQLAAEKKAYAELAASSKKSNRSTSFNYTTKKDTKSRSYDHSGSSAGSGSEAKNNTKEKIYLEGYYTALEEMGYFDEEDDYDYDEYDEYEDAYDEDAEMEAYLEGYYTAMLDEGYDIDEL